MINQIEENEDYSTTIPDPNPLNEQTEFIKPEVILETEIPFTSTLNCSPVIGLLSKNTTNVNVYIKPARKTSEHYLSSFPKSLYCQPYKYDVSITMPTYLYQMHSLQIGLIDNETGKQIGQDKPGVQIEKITETNHSSGTTDIQIRFFFVLCSFHHFKRAFLFVINLRDDLGGHLTQIYTSGAFHTYARKTKDLDVWSKKRKTSVKLPEEKDPKKIVNMIQQQEKSPCQPFLELDLLSM